MTSRSVKLDIDVTREKLDALGLGYASEALDTLLSEAVSTEMSAHQLLERILDIERAGREERRIKTMMKTSKIPTGQTLENFDLAQFPKCMHGLLIAAARQARGDALPTMPMRWNHRR